MTATAHVASVVSNTGSHNQRSKRNTPSQSFLTDQHPVYGGKAEVVRTSKVASIGTFACGLVRSESMFARHSKRRT